VSATLTIDGKTINITDPVVAKKYGFDPLSNCNGLTFGDGKFVISTESAAKILNDEYEKIGSDKGNDPKAIPDHDVVTVGQEGSVDESRRDSATKQKGGNVYTQKNDVTRAKKNQTIDQVADYNEEGNSLGIPSDQLVRNYYKKIEKQLR
jgi:hypothetical protein